MKLLFLILLVTLVVCDDFYGIQPRLTGQGTPWFRSSLRESFSPRVLFYNPRNIQKEFSDRFESTTEDLNDEDSQPIHKWPISRNRESIMGHVQPHNKFFFVDSEASIVDTVRPLFGDPLQFFNINNRPQAYYPNVGELTRPIFARRTVSTFMTVTSTVITPVVSICVPSSLFTSPFNATSCIRRRRDYNVEDVHPSPVIKDRVIPTNLVFPRSDAVHEIESSKEDEFYSVLLNFPSRQDKRLRLIKTSTSTVTVFVFNPTVLKKSINPVASPALICIPPGLVIC